MKDTNQDLALIVGANLKRYIRLSRWKTQAEFAYAFGAEERTVGRWCNQGIDKLSLIQQLAEFLNIDIMKMFEHNGN